MFAVPGWSVSADSLKPELPALAKQVSEGGSKKRKRPGRPRHEAITDDNVTQFYQSLVKATIHSPPQSKTAKRQNKTPTSQHHGDKAVLNGGAEKSAKSTALQQEQPPKLKHDKTGPKDKKDKKKRKNAKSLEQHDKPQEAQSATAVKSREQKPAPEPAASLPPPPPTLTPLQAAMRDKLVSARFRHLNETLYTRPSDESFGLFQDSPDMFDEYHEGFRRQVKVWPENPVDSFLDDIRSRAKIRQQQSSSSKSGGGRPRLPPPPRSSRSLTTSPLPRTGPICTIADLGCGDAVLAQSLQADKAKLRLDVVSYDLQSRHPLITAADIARLPRDDGSVNVAIFCLALMGTNWIDFVEEAFRVLHWKGELWVAEIRSRFGPVRNKHAPVDHSVGHRRKTGKKSKSASGDGDDDAVHVAADLAVVVDGADDTSKETDVSAFVDVLASRGFLLGGEPSEAIDLDNKMFVKMRFIKGATPTRGRAAVKVKANESGSNSNNSIKPSFAPKTGDGRLGEPSFDESAILKPCVYKIR